MRPVPRSSHRSATAGLRTAVLSAVVPVLWLTGAAQADVWEDRNALRAILDGFGDKGFMMPVQQDMDGYLYRDVQGALDLARTMQGDDCTRAVRLALFLDAHRVPGAATMAARVYEAGLLGDLAQIWILPDGNSVVDLLSRRWDWWNEAASRLDVLRKLVLSYDALVTFGNDLALSNRDLWVQEIVDLSLRSNWDRAELAHAVSRLDSKIRLSVTSLDSTEDWAQARASAAEQAYERDLDLAKAERRDALARLRNVYGAYYVEIQPAEVERIDRVFFQALHEARTRRDESLAEIAAARAFNLKLALEDLAKARIQKAALGHFTVPILAGQCQGLTVAKQPALPVRDAPPPEGGYWALVQGVGRVTLPFHSDCYAEDGSISDGTAELTVSKPRCGDPWPSFSVSYTWSTPPRYLVPGQPYEVGASLTGSFGAGWGDGSLSYAMDLAHIDCGGATAAKVPLIRTAEGHIPGVSAKANDRAVGSGRLVGPEKTYGEHSEADTWRFQVMVSANLLGCYRYIYEWRDAAE